MGRRFERDKNDVKYGWRYAADNSDVALIGGSSGYEILLTHSENIVMRNGGIHRCFIHTLSMLINELYIFRWSH